MKPTYMTQLIEEREYAKWLDGEKVVIQAPTGMGKNFFVIKVFVPYCKRRRRKVLLLGNRRLLKAQLEYSLAEEYPRYAEMEDDIEILTYQQLAEYLKKGHSLKPLLDQFDVIICDEFHYFYSDADFNAHGTYVLLQALVEAGFYKTMIFMSATMKEVYPLLEKTLLQCEKTLKLKDFVPNIEKYCYHEKIYDYNYLADFSRFSCFYLSDPEALMAEIAKSDKKTLFFIDDVARAQEMKSLLEQKFEVPKEEIKLLSSQVLEDTPNDEFVRKLLIANKLSVKILITTSVLDNGVSIHDPDVGNVIIATESRVSFMQMLGRVRGEKSKEIKLFIYPRESSYYEKRVAQYKDKLEKIKKLGRIDLEDKYFEVLINGWYGRDAAAEFMRSMLVQTTDVADYFSIDYNKIVRRTRRDPVMVLNAFAVEKIGNQAHAEMKFLSLSYEDDPAAVAREQIGWLNKSPRELVVLKSSYIEEREAALKKMLLEVKAYSNQAFQDVKKDIALEFGNNILKSYKLPLASFDTKKLVSICEKYGLVFIKEEDGNKKFVYTIKEKSIED